MELACTGGHEEAEQKALDDESINDSLLFNNLEYRGKQ